MAMSSADDVTTVFNESHQIKSNKNKLIFKLDIEDFLKLPQENTEAYQSKVFPSAKNAFASWILLVYPRGETSDDSEYVSLYLELQKATEYPVSVNYTVKVMNSTGYCIGARFNELYLFRKAGKSFGYPRMLSRREIRKALETTNSGTLTIEYDITACVLQVVTKGDGCGDTRGDGDGDNVNLYVTDVWRVLHSSGQFTDCIIRVQSHQFPVHKCILQAASPMFASMLAKVIKGEVTKEITLAYEVDPAVFERLLQLIYQGGTLTSMDEVMALLPVTVAYEFKHLREHCEAYLCANLTIETAVKIFIVAANNGLNSLKAKSINFIISHVNELTKTADWDIFAKKFPSLHSEISVAALKHDETEVIVLD